MSKSNKKENFEKALKRLKEAVIKYNTNKSDDIVRDGLIQRFEFTYELSWKAAKEKLEEIGISEINSPRAVFKEAFSQNIVSNEEIWLLIIKDRNLTSHTYKEELANEIANRITTFYEKEFESLLGNLKKD